MVLIEITYVNFVQITVQFSSSILLMVAVVVYGAQTDVIGEITFLAPILCTQTVFAHFVFT